eukprot:NODE_1971_length_1170_cov_8.035475_g1954_i0.p2 GENE.NODE_1971_length_1170_cov_8.035475_g1954_i0~~NODE_1971_length_1170_cov_8.035475_g1954_i0.p2  ORF type:complete len:182 (-),score=59.80 NODE_1971_length_1170_cov_8.035475_g1954_i0:498-1043(-)
MVKLFSHEHSYKHSWGNVTLAWWRKYPNKYSAHVKEVDCYRRELDASSGTFTAWRLLACEQSLPSWVVALGISPNAYALEKTEVNAKDKTMVVRSRNITGSSLMVVEETCTYTEDEENKEWTHYKQEAKISAFMPFVYHKLEKYTVDSFAQKSQQGLQVIEGICEDIVQNGLKAFESLGLE